MSTATAGRAREHRTRDRLIDHGWIAVMRAAGSKGAGDLLMGHPDHGAALIQVGTHNKTLGPDARERFVSAAELIGALPLLATWSHSGLRCWLVTRDKPATWNEWSYR